MNSQTHPPAEILVIGAGLAGVFAARALLETGYRVRLADESEAPAARSSGNPAGIFKPILTPTATISSRLSLAALPVLASVLADLDPAAVPQGRGGILQIARDSGEASKLQRALTQRAWLGEVALGLEAREVSRRIGWESAFGGVWFPQGGWVDPRALCAATVDWFHRMYGDRFRVELGQPVSDAIAGAAEAVVYCTAESVRALPDLQRIRTQVIRGQLSELEFTETVGLPSFPLVFHDYVVPLSPTRIVMGATHDRDDESVETRVDDHRRMLERFGAMLPPPLAGLDRLRPTLRLRAGLRFTTASRVPLVGSLPEMSARLRRPTWCLTALGSRGILLAPLLGRVLAAKVSGQPSLVDSDIAQALEPQAQRN